MLLGRSGGGGVVGTGGGRSGDPALLVDVDVCAFLRRDTCALGSPLEVLATDIVAKKKKKTNSCWHNKILLIF